MSAKYLILDYETRSEVDLKLCGSHEYAKHPSTKILCASWRFGTKAELRHQLDNKIPSSVWSPAKPGNGYMELSNMFAKNCVGIVAHNALFEQVITRFVFPRHIPKNLTALQIIASGRAQTLPHERWVCTAAMASALALPRNLEGACQALNLPVQKDMEGRKLILKYCKPRKPTKNNPDKWHSKMEDLERIIQYCQTDVDAETELFLTLPELNPTERKVWLLDQKINFRGLTIDTPMVNSVLSMIDTEVANLTKETKELTGLTSTNQRNSVLEWLKSNDVILPDLRAKTVSDAIQTGMVTNKARRVLEIRQAISKTSTAKYEAFKHRSTSDGHVRDILLYHGASTGRWSGTGVQPQNFPKGSIEDTDTAADIVRTGDLELIRLLYGDPMKAFSSCLRSVIIPNEGYEFFCADYAAIEARVLFWIADHTSGIKAFFENRPMYEEMACVIYNIENIEKVTKMQRQVGKQAVLGCGYGMGATKFQATCHAYSIEVDEITAKKAVKAYRTTHSHVPRLWSNLEQAAIAAVENGGKSFAVNNTKWLVKDGFLWCELPSGRKLAYYKPEVRYEEKWDEKRPVLYHWCTNPVTRQWEIDSTYGGKLTENVVQAIARDLMAEALLRIDAHEYAILLTVHDEILAERLIGEGNLPEFERLMSELPEWARGCPVTASGWQGFRYKK